MYGIQSSSSLENVTSGAAKRVCGVNMDGPPTKKCASTMTASISERQASELCTPRETPEKPEKSEKPEKPTTEPLTQHERLGGTEVLASGSLALPSGPNTDLWHPPDDRLLEAMNAIVADAIGPDVAPVHIAQHSASELAAFLTSLENFISNGDADANANSCEQAMHINVTGSEPMDIE